MVITTRSDFKKLTRMETTGVTESTIFSFLPKLKIYGLPKKKKFNTANSEKKFPRKIATRKRDYLR